MVMACETVMVLKTINNEDEQHSLLISSLESRITCCSFVGTPTHCTSTVLDASCSSTVLSPIRLGSFATMARTVSFFDLECSLLVGV